MSGLNTYFVPLTILQEQFWDKLNDAPLAGGKLYFYQDEARTIPKPVYVLTGSPPDYSYETVSPTPNVVTLSSIGTVDDGLGNNLVIYGYPYDDNLFDGGGNVQLYYMSVYNSDGQFQFDVGGFPNISTEGNPAHTAEKNFIKNGQFVLNEGSQSIAATETALAYGGWYYIRSSNTATDNVSFYRFGSPIEGGIPSGNPRYACEVACSSTGTDAYKVLEVRFNDVNRFSDTVQTLSLYFEAKSAVGSSISVNLYKNFGTGGSDPISTQIMESTALTSSWTPFTTSFAFGSNVGQTIGTNNDDYFSIQIVFPPTTTFDVLVTDFVLYLGTETITAYPFSTDSYNDAQISKTFNTINVQKFTSSGTYTPSQNMIYCTIECWGAGGGGGGLVSGITTSYALTAGGGGAGGYSRKTVSATTIGASQVVTVGASAAGGVTLSRGGTGGTTSVGSLCVAYGGEGALTTTGGLGGHTGVGDIAVVGQNGLSGGITFQSSSNAIIASGALGGSTAVGSGGQSQSIGFGGVVWGWNAIGYGSGGSGGAIVGVSNASTNGGSSGGGLVVITEYIFNF